MDDQLIPRFVELHKQTEQLLEEDNAADAKQKYLEVLEAYHAIQKSPLEKYHKDLAYSQITQLFSKVNEAKERVKIPYNLIAAAVLIIAFSILVVLKPSIVGLVGMTDMVRQPINVTFQESGLYDLTLSEKPLSIALTGEVNGTAKVFYKQGSKLELIVDTSKLENSTFSDVCVETCTISADSNTLTLFVELSEGSSLTLVGATYKVEPRSNTAPVWKGKSKNFKAKLNTQMTIDLNDYFKDDDGDNLVFLSTTDDGLDLIVQDSYVTINPLATGTKNVVFIASDLRDVTRVPVSIDVE